MFAGNLKSKERKKGMEATKYWLESILVILRKVYKVLLHTACILAVILSIAIIISPFVVGVFLGRFLAYSESLIWIKVAVGVGTFLVGWFINYIGNIYFAVPVLRGAIKVGHQRLIFNFAVEARDDYMFRFWPLSLFVSTLFCFFFFSLGLRS